MKKIVKLLLSSVSVLAICLSISTVNAAVTYSATATSGYHRVGSGAQYYVVDAECLDFGSDRSVNSWTFEWYHTGSGSHKYSNSEVRISGRGNYTVFYTGSSVIDNQSSPLSATIEY